MTDNKTQANATGKAGQSIEQAKDRLLDRKKELGSYHVLAQELGVNVSYVYCFLEHGMIPKNRKVRKALGIVEVSRGAKIYRALNEKAKVAGWGSWSEYRRAILDGECPLTSKAIASYYRPTKIDELLELSGVKLVKGDE